MKRLVIATAFFLACPAIHAATFGPQIVKSPLTVKRIFQGSTSTIYVTFAGVTLTGCSGNGGYLRPSWPAAGAIDHEVTDRMLSVLLAAKAQDLSLEVRYRVNSDGTGWDKCSIDGLYLH